MTGTMNTRPQVANTYKVGKLRLSQVITTFGPGAVMDLPRESVIIAGLDNWPEISTKGQLIQDPRLESSLSKERFYAPPLVSQLRSGGVPCARFPKWLICSRCGLFTKRKACNACGADAYPARLIVICPAGHADDFPWNWWVHRKRPCTGQSRLMLSSQKKTAALSDLVVECLTCKEKQPLGGALGPTALGGLKCTGERPWLIGSQPEFCAQKPRSVLRGASNVYFASILSALSIPPWSDQLQILLNTFWPMLGQLSIQTLRDAVGQLREFSGYTVDDVIEAFQRRKNNTTTPGNLRREEYLAFRNPGNSFNQPLPLSDFMVRSESVPAAFQPRITRVILADRLREVSVLRGFTRIDPPDAENVDQVISPIFLNEQDWLPAVEHRGEGIFLDLNEQLVREWESRPTVQERMRKLNLAYNTWREQRNLPPAFPVPPRTVLLHTLAHLLIRQLALECGYSSTSLRERIYAGNEMCGLLIYTASADADGSLGGLVQQGLQNRFEVTLQMLLEHARWCSADPLCVEHDPTTTGKINGASCHVCSLVAETSCEKGNRFLDRAFLTDLPGLAAGTGYF